MQVVHNQLYRQRVQKRLTLLNKRLLAFVIKANPECFDHDGRLAPGCFPARIPPEAADLHGQMRRAEFQLAMIRLHADVGVANSSQSITAASKTAIRDLPVSPRTA